MPHPVREALTAALGDGVFPGAVLLVEVAGQITFFEAVGHAATVPTPAAMTTDAVFDLASLTKPLVTAALVLSFVAEHRLSLDDPVGTYRPRWREGLKARATLRHLLAHASGLPDWRPLYRNVDAALVGTPEANRRIVGAADTEPLISDPGAETRYSDLGFIVLGAILEEVAQRSLDELARERLFAPLGLSSVGYLPTMRPSARAWLSGRSVVATERCAWRGRVLRGEVHDENAFAMGGVSGHAGLFGDAMAVWGLVRAWNEAAAGRRPAWPSDLVTAFVTRQSDLGTGTWALGWTVPTPPSTSGRFFSPRSYGHLGFTGTSVWVDPDRELTVILLTNRVHPTRENQAIAAFRPAIHDAIYRWLFDKSAR